MRQDQDLLMSSLARFYADKRHISAVLPIIQGSSPTPLRLFNWLATVYSRENNLVLRKRTPTGESYLNVHVSYRTQLRTFSKAQFDPFRRDEKRRIVFQYDPENPEKRVETTVGQLNFFRWVLESGVLDYVQANLSRLESAMRAAGSGARPAAGSSSSSSSSLSSSAAAGPCAAPTAGSVADVGGAAGADPGAPAAPSRMKTLARNVVVRFD